MKLKILITRPMYPDVIEKLRNYFDVEINEGAKYSTAQLAVALQGKDGVLLAGGEKIDEEFVALIKGLKAVCISAAGYNNVDVKALTKAGIIVTNSPGPADETVADFAWGLMIAAARKMLESSRWLLDGNWKSSHGSRFFGTEINGKILGIMGMGRIGQAIARRASGFNMTIFYHNRHQLEASVEKECKATWLTKTALLQQSDFIVLAMPFAKENYHLIGHTELELCKSSAILVNIARGGLIDEKALTDALKQKKLAAAALDVFEGEPEVYEPLRHLQNVILTPHIAGGTELAQHGLAEMAADNLIAALGYGLHAFHPPAILNPELLPKS